MGMLLTRHYKVNTGAAKEVAPTIPESKVQEVVAESKSKDLEITSDDIKKMNGARLRKLAKVNGIADPEELTVNELKAILCEKYS